MNCWILMEEVLETGENQLDISICKIDGIEEADDRLAWHKPNPSMEYMPIFWSTRSFSGLSGNEKAAKQKAGVYDKEDELA